MTGSLPGRSFAVTIAFGLLCLSSPLRAQAVIQSAGEIPSTALDQFGDTIGGIGSGIAYDEKNDLFFCVTDRGPGDGTIPFHPRYLKLRFTQEKDSLQITVVGSVIFKDADGREMTGLIPTDSTAVSPRMTDGRTCLDPEAIAIAPDGSLYVTDEYGPYLYQFHPNGRMIRRIPLHDRFSPRTAEGRLDFTPGASLVSGRNINQGPEGMCILPDGRHAALAFQSGLVQSGGHQSPTTLIAILDLQTEKTIALYAYPFATQIPETGEPLDISTLSLNDMCALDSSRFLILERDSSGRNGARDYPPARYKSVWLADISGATNLLDAPANAPITPAGKQFLFNLPRIVSDPSRLAAKWEGITIIPPVKKNHLTLMMSADNDFLAPTIHENGETHSFPRAQDAVPSQFFKIRVPLAKNP